MDKYAELVARYNKMKGTLSPEANSLISDILTALGVECKKATDAATAYEQEKDAHDRLLAIL